MHVWTFPGCDVAIREFFLGNFKSLCSCFRHGWQNKSTMVFSLSVLQHYAMSSVNRVCHLFRSAIIMPLAVCPSSVFKNWSKLPNSKWNTDGWCSRVHSYLSGQKVWGLPQCFGNGLRVYNYRSRQKVWGLLQCFWQWPQGLQLSEWTEGLRIPAMLWQWPQGLQLSEWTEGLRISAMLWQWLQGLFTTIRVDRRSEDPCSALAEAAGFTAI